MPVYVPLPATIGFDALQGTPPSVASAATCNIYAANSYIVNITGIVTITAFDTAPAGVRRLLVFTGTCALTHNATSLILPTSTGITMNVGDAIEFQSLGSGNWRCISIQAGTGGLTGSYVVNQSTAGVLGFASTNICQWNATQFRALQTLAFVDGAVGSPGLALGAETTTGLYKVAAGDLGTAILGVQQHHTTANGLLHTGRHQTKRGADIACAASITLGNDGNVFNITGAAATLATISSTNVQDGCRMTLIFTAASTWNNTGNITFRSPTTTKTNVAGDTYDIVWDSTKWRVLA